MGTYPGLHRSTWAILCTPFGRKVASWLASDGGIDDRWELGGLRSLAAAAGRKPTSFHCADGTTPSRGSASHGLDCFRAESCSPLGERMAVPHHFIPLLLGCLSASLKMVRDVTSRAQRLRGSSRRSVDLEWISVAEA